MSQGLPRCVNGRPKFLNFVGLVFLVFVLGACEGDDGQDGEPGPPGPPGPPSGVDIGSAEEIHAEITGVTIASPPVVTFTLFDQGGAPVRNLPADAISFTIAQLVPGTDGNASAWQSYINSVEDPGAGPGTEPQPQAGTENGSNGTLEEDPSGNGSYSYTFATDVANVTEPVPVPYDPDLTHRVTFEIRGYAPVVNPVYDFRPSDGATDGIFSRTIVKTESCNACHENLALHGGARFEVDQCQTCHNPGTADANSGNTVDLAVMIHKIHRGEGLPSVVDGEDYCIYGRNDSLHCYGDVAHPQDIRNCETCHNEADPETPDAANWYRVPTVEACGACHDDVDFETGAGHAGGPSGNDRCSSCHDPDTVGGLGAYQKHRIQAEEDAERYSLNILAVDFLVPGTAPTVTFSVTDPTNGDMPYDLANDPDLTQSASGLRFYSAWETTDYENDGQLNGHAAQDDVYSPGGALQATDNGNFTYSMPLTAIPLGTQGSGGIIFAGRVDKSFGRVRPDNTHAFFGITDDPANPTPRRMKADIERCNDCHKRLAIHGDQTNNLQTCVTCHDPAAVAGGGGAIDFKSFIHKLHTASDLRYPQRSSNCIACHTDDGFYPVALGSGVLASSFDIGASLGSNTDNIRISPNASACGACHTSADAEVHMQQNGGSFDACQAADGTIRERVDDCSAGGTPGNIVQESCTVCHGAGSGADVAVMHSLNLD